MILQVEIVRERLRLLEEIAAELERQPTATANELARDVPRRWILERGLIADDLPVEELDPAAPGGNRQTDGRRGPR